MAQTNSMVGNLSVQLTSGSKPQPIPVNFSFEWTEAAMQDLAWLTDQVATPIPKGTVNAPRMVYVEVLEGTLTLSTDPTGAGGWTLRANPSPQVGDPPARLLFFTFAASNMSLYATTSGPTRIKIWQFE